MGSKVSRPYKPDCKKGSSRCHHDAHHCHVNHENYAYSPRHRKEPRQAYHDHSRKVARATPRSRRARRDFEVPISPNIVVRGSRSKYADDGGVRYTKQVKTGQLRKQAVEEINQKRRREWEIYRDNMVQTIGGRYYF